MAQTSILTRISTDSLPESSEEQKVVDESKPKISTRLLSLDSFRGLTIFLMLLVNNVALDTQTPAQLMHAKWNLGLRMADLVFPWFLFCVGVALPYSHASFIRKGKSQAVYLGKAFLRGGLLVIIGALLDSAINHKLAFSLGVLQLIGLAYFVAAVAYETRPWIRVLFGTGLLVAYGTALLHLNFPGGHAGVMDESNNWVRHFNNAYLEKYQLRGLLSTIPTAALVLYGTLIGDILRQANATPIKKLVGIFSSAIAFVAVGDIWSVFLPYNKPIWTPSYILVAGGLGAACLGIFYIVVDLGKQKWIAYPFRIFGSNAIAAYVFPILLKVLVLQIVMVRTSTGNKSVQTAIIEWLKGNYGNVQGGWFYTGAYILVWWIILWGLYQRKLFLRV